MNERVPVRPQCLLVLPVNFYGFGSTVSASLRARGMDVEMVNDEFPVNLAGRLLGKLRLLKPLRWLTLRTFIKRFGDKGRLFDLVLIIKGRGMSKESIGFLQTIAKRVVAYNFDSFRFNPSPLDWMRSVDRYCTFDIQDARDHELPLVHLFSALAPEQTAQEKRYDVSVLMKNHSQRLAYTDEVLSALPDHVSRFVYIFEPSLLSFGLSILRTPWLYLKYFRSIHLKPLPYPVFLRTMAASRVTIDFAHPLQTGITIRCFEARSLGVSIVTNNAYVFEHPFFNQGTVAHFSLGGPAQTLLTEVKRLLAAPPHIALRTVDDFIAELLAEPDPAASTPACSPA